LTALGDSEDGSDDIDRDVEVKGVEESLGVGVNLESSNRSIESGDFGDVVVLALALFLLELERDTTDGSLLDALHQVGGEARDFVAQAFGGDSSDFIDNALVGVEIEGQAGVVFLDEDAGSPFGGFGTNATLGGHRINISASWAKLSGRIPC